MSSTNYKAAKDFYEEHGNPNLLKFIYLRHKTAYIKRLSNTYSKSTFKGGILQPSPFELICRGLKTLLTGIYNLLVSLIAVVFAPILVSLLCIVEAYKNKQHLKKYIEQADDL